MIDVGILWILSNGKIEIIESLDLLSTLHLQTGSFDQSVRTYLKIQFNQKKTTKLTDKALQPFTVHKMNLEYYHNEHRAR